MATPISTSTTVTHPYRNPEKSGELDLHGHSLLFPDSPTRSELESELILRFEPLIVAMECKDLALAQSLVSTVRSARFREFGITNANNKCVIVTICCSIRLEVSLGTTEFVMVSSELVRYLVRVTNKKMEETEKERI